MTVEDSSKLYRITNWLMSWKSTKRINPKQISHKIVAFDNQHEQHKCKKTQTLSWRTYRFISWKSISPLPSTSYILNAQASFSSGVPAEVTWSASMNSLKSIVPLLSVSKVLKTFSLNFSAFPPGNILEYISTNCVLVSSPSGQSSRNPWCHSWGIAILQNRLTN